MEFKAALASSIVAYLPNSLYRAFWVEVQLAAGHDPALLGRIVDHEVKPIGLCVDWLRDKEDKAATMRYFFMSFSSHNLLA